MNSGYYLKTIHMIHLFYKFEKYVYHFLNMSKHLKLKIYIYIIYNLININYYNYRKKIPIIFCFIRHPYKIVSLDNWFNKTLEK